MNKFGVLCNGVKYTGVQCYNQYEAARQVLRVIGPKYYAFCGSTRDQLLGDSIKETRINKSEIPPPAKKINWYKYLKSLDEMEK